MKFRKRFEVHLAPAAAGCMAVLFAAQALWAQETKEKVTVDDVERTFMVRLPRGYDSQQHYPVVILLHGMNQDADDMERLTRFDELADKDGIIAVYPFALHGRWNVGVQPQERQPTTMAPGRRRRYGGGGYPGGGGGYPGGGGGYPGGAGRSGGIGIPGIGGMGRGRGNSGGSPRGGAVSPCEGTVRWESARPVLDAMKSPLPEAFEGRYVICVSGIPLMGGRSISGIPLTH